jgi:hypothetical protein
MLGAAEHSSCARPIRGLCLVVRSNELREGRQSAVHERVSKFPRRPDHQILSESIPLFFVGRNRHGFWVVREAEGRTGGIFLFKRSALRFAKKHSAPVGCATMFLTERFELDVENRGSPLVAWLHALRGLAAKLIPDHPPAIPIGRRIFRGERP